MNTIQSAKPFQFTSAQESLSRSIKVHPQKSLWKQVGGAFLTLAVAAEAYDTQKTLEKTNYTLWMYGLGALSAAMIVAFVIGRLTAEKDKMQETPITPTPDLNQFAASSPGVPKPEEKEVKGDGKKGVSSPSPLAQSEAASKTENKRSALSKERSDSAQSPLGDGKSKEGLPLPSTPATPASALERTEGKRESGAPPSPKADKFNVKQLFYSKSLSADPGGKLDILAPDLLMKKLHKIYQIADLMGLISFVVRNRDGKGMKAFKENLQKVLAQPKGETETQRIYAEMHKASLGNIAILDDFMKAGETAPLWRPISTFIDDMTKFNVDWVETANKFRFMAAVLTVLLVKVGKLKYTETDTKFSVNEVDERAKAEVMARMTTFLSQEPYNVKIAVKDKDDGKKEVPPTQAASHSYAIVLPRSRDEERPWSYL